jgi:hypothetical protein
MTTVTTMTPVTTTFFYTNRILNTKTPYIYLPDRKRDENMVSVYGLSAPDSLFRTPLPGSEHIGLPGCASG